MVALANLNHVVVRGFEIALKIFRDAQDGMRVEWAEAAVAEERARIKNAIPFLHAICTAFEQEGLDVTVIKSLDHWPDLGSDLDLYTNATPEASGPFDEARLPGGIGCQKLGRSTGSQVEFPDSWIAGVRRNSRRAAGPDRRADYAGGSPDGTHPFDSH